MVKKDYVHFVWMCLGSECLSCHVYFLKLMYFDIWCFMFCGALCCLILVYFMPLVEIHCFKQNFDLIEGPRTTVV